MNRILVAIAFAGLASVAGAADLAPPAPVVPPPPAASSVYDWNGFYVGAHGGYSWNETETELSEVVGPLLTLDVENGVFPREIEFSEDGLIGGIQAGYDMQFGMWVAGVQADVSWFAEEQDELFSVIDPGPPPFFGARVNTTYRSELDWLGTLRLRGGFAFDRALIYVTGGVALGGVDNTLTIRIPSLGYAPPAWSSEDTEWGWALGAGAEYAVTQNLSVKLDFLHYDLDDSSVLATDPVTFPGQSLEYDYENSGNIVRAGFNFRF